MLLLSAMCHVTIETINPKSINMNEFCKKIKLPGLEIFTKHITQSATRANAPTLVFLHEGLGSIELWKEFPHQLCEATGLEGFLYDRQGYGKSSPMQHERNTNYLHEEAWSILPMLLDKADIQNVILVGHSDGGTIALLFAGRFSERVSGVISEAAHVFVEEETIRGVQDARLSYQLTNLRSRLAPYHGDKTSALFDFWSKTWLSPDFRNWNIEGELQNVRCPVLAIQGTEDRYGTQRQVRSIVDKTAGRAEELVVYGASHTPHAHKDDVLPSMKAFVERILAEIPS